jgi:acyl-coenzyme A synthetase/AMP-(fatty) acid ligase
MGQRLLPSLVDDIARSDPSRILYSVARAKDPADGFGDISSRDFARAVNRCALFIDGALGRGQGFPTLVYMGPHDLNYAILVLASIKTGYKRLLTSPRNILEAHLSLLDTTDCRTLLAPVDFPLPVISQILAARPLRRVEVPAGHQWFKNNDVAEEPYPYMKTFTVASADPFVVLHTSGSTGTPKPII